jgi:hypothetical protein
MDQRKATRGISQNEIAMAKLDRRAEAKNVG